MFAVRAEEVVVDAEGSRCLLWAADRHRTDSRAGSERLKHCIRAARHGQAEGLLAFADGSRVDPSCVLFIRVECHHGEYWAKWGGATRALPPSLARLRADREYGLAGCAGACR
jgi:hypothetical protein